jgi:drug/metabolite transporter (DMT)-like permease
VLLFYTFPVVTLGVERFFFKQQVAPAALLCIIVIFDGAALIAVPGLRNGTIDPRGLAWAVPGPVIYAFYLAANARLLGRHPPLIGAGFLYGGLAAALGAILNCLINRRILEARDAVGPRVHSFAIVPATLKT